MTGLRSLIVVLIVSIVPALVVAGTTVETAIRAQNPGAQAQSPAADQAQPPVADKDVKVNEKKVEEGEAYARQMLLLMDRDKNGKVSRQEFMDFMAAEFEKMGKNKDCELDVKELTRVRLLVHAGAPHR